VLEILSIDPRLPSERFAASRPYRDPRVLERFLGALRQAGLPDGHGSVSADGLSVPWAAARRCVALRRRR
jgi:hypothetical protein